MSFSTEVIEIVKETETQEVKKTITKLGFETKKFQEKIRQYLDANFVEFLPDLTSNEFYLNEGEQLGKDVQNLLDHIENETKHQLLNANNELQQYFNELSEASLGMKISLKLVRIYELFSRLENAKSCNEQLNIMNIIAGLKSLIHDPADKILPQLDCYQSIKIKYQVESEMMLHNLKLKFENLVQLHEKVFQSTKSVTIRITRDETQLHETVIALTNSKFNPKKMCTFLIENVFEPIITKPVSIEYDDITNDDYVTMQLSFNNSEVNTNLRPNYKIIFKNLETAIKCLGHMNVTIAEGRCVFTIFAQYMKERFFQLIIQECLAHSIPETMDEMDESTIVSDIHSFNDFLIQMMFIGELDEDAALLKYSEKIDILFQNRFCANILDSSIEIMHRDLHDMILVSDNNVAEAAKATQQANIFPKCMISKSTLELINLMEKIIRQSESVQKDEIANRLYSTISIILDRYTSEVPTFHAKLLLNIPQQTALFHNNSMYLAFWLQKHTNLEFCHEIEHSIQRQGSEYLSKQIANQKSQILDILKEFELNVATSELGPTPCKVVRQCLRQLDLLKNVWQTILPDSVYNKTMGTLLNDFCNEIIRRILIVEDLPAQVANGLTEICSTIIERGPMIFEDPLAVNVNVKLWMKLKQMKMILGASLIEITDQWSERKGPLAINYKADEIKHLIRALFQNTDYRANALSLIV